jgi:hypothetical protein
VQRASLANEYGTVTGTGTGSGSDDVLRCVFDVYAQASMHILLQVVGTLFVLAHTYHRVCIIVVG